MYTVGTTVSEAVDKTFWFIILASVILLLLVTFLMIYFAVKYNHKRRPEPEAVKQSMWLEVVWTIIPTILVLAMFYYGYEGFLLMRQVPEDAMQVQVTGRMWDWSFEYENGKRSDKLYVPKDRSVKLNMKSLDVLHSFYIPAFRIKEDVVPGRETYLWFKPQTVGPADIFCAEFCGQRHAYMLSQVITMEPADWEIWYNQKADEPALDMVELKKLPAVQVMDEYGCLDCHSIDRSKGERIPLNGLFGQTKIVMKDGKETEVLVDEAYLRRALIEPGAEVAKDQIDQMEPVTDLTEEQIQLILDYLKELK